MNNYPLNHTPFGIQILQGLPGNFFRYNLRAVHILHPCDPGEKFLSKANQARLIDCF
jgi:hypothetical protein